jgi:hypothetical protein
MVKGRDVEVVVVLSSFLTTLSAYESFTIGPT